MWQLRNPYWFITSLSSRIISRKQELKSCIKNTHKDFNYSRRTPQLSSLCILLILCIKYFLLHSTSFFLPSPEITRTPGCSVLPKTLSTHKRKGNITESLTFLTGWFWRIPGIIFITGNYLCSNHVIALITLKHNWVLISVGKSKSRFFSPIFNSGIFTFDHWKRGNIC